MHREILTHEQVLLLPLLAQFKKDFGLVGGTAVALHLGHRESIDFDLFSHKSFGNLSLQRRIEKVRQIDEILVNKEGEFTFVIDSVKFTFLNYPFDIDYSESFENVIRLPTLLTLAAMKAFAIGQRNKWKDYVDMYFIIRDYYSVEKISMHAHMLFGDKFNGRMFRNQLSYFDDINYAERVVFRPGFEVPDEEVRCALIEYSLA
ncbi:nucleotidyl transferase AbiEii/AbiGii toxin family protein [Candidatus Kaiserbacteria bacterium]|nr:nucleotidyl transferase AbiEii/AbiGii toxin family protein [Candidatus Kaiserbacteria bacterium]